MGHDSQEMDLLKKRYKEVCADLNLDKAAADEAWLSFQRIGMNYTLEGDKLQWLACALYVSCRRGVTPTVGGSRSGSTAFIEGNCVSLTRLLRSCSLSLVQFFSKMKKWSDMASLPHEMRDKVDHLERNFSVSTVIFNKFKPIFLDIFKDPTLSPSKPKSRKPLRKVTVTSNDVFSFCWTLFIHVKANFSAISDDLVNSYHLLLACIDFCYSNALVAENAKELLNPSFPELPEDLNESTFKVPESVPCIIQYLCSKWDGIIVDAKGIKEHWWKPSIKRMVERKLLKSRPSSLPHLLGFFDSTNYEFNFRSITQEYDAHVLNKGDFDERIFVSDTAEQDIGTNPNGGSISPDITPEELTARMSAKASLRQHMEEVKSMTPQTPLTNRHYLKKKSSSDNERTPVSSATQTVSQLHTLLIGYNDKPSKELLDMFQECGSKDPTEIILKRVEEMSQRFVTAYSRPVEIDPCDSDWSKCMKTSDSDWSKCMKTSDSDWSKCMKMTHEEKGSESVNVKPVLANSSINEFAKKRLELVVALYYKVLENIMKRERKRLKDGTSCQLSEKMSNLLSNEMFHLSLFTCCIEIVVFSYNSKRTFPWIIDVYEDFKQLKFQPYYFYKVIELVIRDEDSLSRSVVKHLNMIEERVLEQLAWKRDSALWDSIRIPGTSPTSSGSNASTGVPSCQDVALPSSTGASGDSILASPLSTVKRLQQFSSPMPSMAADRFSSPVTSAKRRLFDLGGSSGSTGTNDPQVVQLQIPTQTASGEVKMIQVPVQAYMVQSKKESSVKMDPPRSRPGPMGLFFRKVYYLAWLRMRDLLDRIMVADEDLKRKVWTCFESSLRDHPELMKDRHIDQILMCAIYAMFKATQVNVTFTKIMESYRLQPQSKSHIYRSVLLSVKKCTPSDDGTNGSQEESMRSDSTNGIRSVSVLPNPAPNSEPSTPTRSSNDQQQSFQFSGGDWKEERGDLIMFYNQVYVPAMKDYIMKFTITTNVTPTNRLLSQVQAPLLSPLPRLSANPLSPYRRISQKHSLFVSPLKPSLFPPSPSRPMSYSFLRSPAKELKAINQMMKMNNTISPEKRGVSKRIFQDEPDTVDGLPVVKRLVTGSQNVIGSKIQNIFSERGSAPLHSGSSDAPQPMVIQIQRAP